MFWDLLTPDFCRESCKNYEKCETMVCSCGHLHWCSPIFKGEYVPSGCNPVFPKSPADCAGYEKKE